MLLLQLFYFILLGVFKGRTQIFIKVKSEKIGEAWSGFVQLHNGMHKEKKKAKETQIVDFTCLRSILFFNVF